MDDATLDARLFEAVIVAMIRNGLLPADVLEQVAEQFDDEAAAAAGVTTRADAEMIAHRARVMILMAANGGNVTP